MHFWWFLRLFPGKNWIYFFKGVIQKQFSSAIRCSKIKFARICIILDNLYPFSAIFMQISCILPAFRHQFSVWQWIHFLNNSYSSAFRTIFAEFSIKTILKTNTKLHWGNSYSSTHQCLKCSAGSQNGSWLGRGYLALGAERKNSLGDV